MSCLCRLDPLLPEDWPLSREPALCELSFVEAPFTRSLLLPPLLLLPLLLLLLLLCWPSFPLTKAELEVAPWPAVELFGRLLVELRSLWFWKEPVPSFESPADPDKLPLPPPLLERNWQNEKNDKKMKSYWRYGAWR